MTTRKIVILGLGNGNGAQMLDHATGGGIYSTQGRFNTDHVRTMEVMGSQLVTCDWDGLLNSYSLDFVHQYVVETGAHTALNRYGSFKKYNLVGSNFYEFARVGYDSYSAAPEASDSQRVYLNKRSLATGLVLEEITLDPDLFDVGTNSSFISQSTSMFGLWTQTHAWAFCNGGVHTGKFVKISLTTGLVEDSFATTLAINEYDYWLAPLGSGKLLAIKTHVETYVDPDYFTEISTSIIDFTAKTVTDNTPVSIAGQFSYYPSSSTSRSPWADLATTTFKYFTEGAVVGIKSLVTFNWVTGASSNITFTGFRADDPTIPLVSPDVLLISSNGASMTFYSERGGYGLFNMATGEITSQLDSIITGSQYVDVESMIVLDLTTYTVTGNVKSLGVNVAREVILHDQDSMLPLSRAWSDGVTGNYSISCFSPLEKLVICTAPPGSDYLIHAHLTPAP